MEQIISWFETHEKLAGWAQAFGAILALLVALLAVYMQSRYTARQEDRRTAERVRSLARTLDYWKGLCEQTYAMRVDGSKKPDIVVLNAIFAEFNHAASEINRFGFMEAPSHVVFCTLSKYRAGCGRLSQFMRPGDGELTLTPAELAEFDQLIGQLGVMVRNLMSDADRIAS